MSGLFERINFFKGLFMEAGDWEKEQAYHSEKRRFHNKYLHTPGVAMGCLGDLKVTAAASGTSLNVAAGYAIDGEGRDLYLPEAKEVVVPPLQSFHGSIILYVTISYKEDEAEIRTNDANPDYSGYAFVKEDTVIDVTNREPDNLKRIELARIQLSETPQFIQDAESPSAPGLDEINMLKVPEAGVPVVATRKALSLTDFAEKVMDTTIQVRSGFKKQDDTSYLIEKVPHADNTIHPMYTVSVQSLDGASTHWWIESSKNRNMLDYSLHIKNNSNRITTVLCRVFRMRI